MYSEGVGLLVPLGSRMQQNPRILPCRTWAWACGAGRPGRTGGGVASGAGRAHAAEHADVALEVLHLVVQPPVLLQRAAVLGRHPAQLIHLCAGSRVWHKT